MKNNQSKFKQTETPLRQDYEGQVGLIPEDWEILELGEAVDFDPSRPIYKGQKVSFVAMTDIDPFDKKIKSSTERNFNGGSKFQNGDTLLARITPCLENGKTAFCDILEKGEMAGGSTEFIVLSGKKEKSDSNFVYYLAISPEIRSVAIQAMAGTSGRQRVQSDKLKNYQIALPPIEDQQKIAEVLGALDEKIELNRKMNKTLEQIGQAIFKRWFVDLKKMPTGWEIVKAESDLKIAYGKNLPTDKLLESGYPVYGGNGIIGFYSKYLYANPQMIIACRGAACGALHKTKPNSFVTNNSLIFEIPGNSPFNIHFLEYYLKSIDRTEFVTGSAQPQITVSNLNHIEILKPDKRTLNHFGKIIEPISDKIYSNEQQIETLSQIRDSLLPRLMSGKLRVE